jgi:hypothetical protein
MLTLEFSLRQMHTSFLEVQSLLSGYRGETLLPLTMMTTILVQLIMLVLFSGNM